MSRWVTKGLGPLPTFGGANIGDRSPFRDIVPVPFDLVYLALYIAVAFIIGAVILGRRDV